MPNSGQSMLYITNCSKHAANLTGSRDAPHVSTLPPDAALFAVEKAIPLLQELGETNKTKKQKTIIIVINTNTFF